MTLVRRKLKKLLTLKSKVLRVTYIEKIEVNVPRKRKGSSAHEKGLARFFEMVYDALKKHVDFDIVKVLIVASPGFYKAHLHYLELPKSSFNEFKKIGSVLIVLEILGSETGRRFWNCSRTEQNHASLLCIRPQTRIGRSFSRTGCIRALG
jgi:hypothetical protein